MPTDPGSGTTLPLELEPYESRLIVFAHRGTLDPLPSTRQSAISQAPLDLSAGWQVSFENGQTVTMNALRSWTEDEATRHYSGKATYEKKFDLPQDYLENGTRTLLDFGSVKALPVGSLSNGTRAWIEGPVRDAALVFLNGERIGAVWHPPYAIEVTRPSGREPINSESSWPTRPSIIWRERRSLTISCWTSDTASGSSHRIWTSCNRFRRA